MSSILSTFSHVALKLSSKHESKKSYTEQKTVGKTISQTSSRVSVLQNSDTSGDQSEFAFSYRHFSNEHTLLDFSLCTKQLDYELAISIA